MSAIRFNQVWAGLLLLAGSSAFVIPQKYTNKIRNVQGLFAPVASPTRKLAAAIDSKIAKPQTRDTRQFADVRAENEDLRVRLMALSGQLDELKRIDAERAAVGEIREFCTPVRVIGSDTGVGESLSLAASAVLMEGMPVVFREELVGRIDRTSRSGTQVQLVTDRSFKVMAEFRHFDKTDGKLELKSRGAQLAVAEGGGDGTIVVKGLPHTEAEKIHVGDSLVLKDPDWPLLVHGRPLGQVVEKSERRDAALFWQIKLKPARKLKELTEVMVVTKK